MNGPIQPAPGRKLKSHLFKCPSWRDPPILTTSCRRGAGGIGFHLLTSIRLFDYRETAVVLIVIILLVVITDYPGARLRARII